MTQSIFNSVRKLNFYNFKTKYINQNESVGELFKKQSIEDFGSIPEPSCLDYDDKLSLLAIGSKKGLIKIFGHPGICFSTRLDCQDEIWNIKFIPGTNFVLTLTSENKLILWLISTHQNELLKVDTMSIVNLFHKKQSTVHKQSDYNNNIEKPIEQNITVIEVIESISSIIMGNGEGSLILVKLDLQKMRKQFDQYKTVPPGNTIWHVPTSSDIINLDRIISKIPIGFQKGISSDAVIHISERPGSRKHLLIGYRSGLSIIYNIQKDSVDYLLPAQISLNGLSWCPPDPIIQDNFLVAPDQNEPQYKLSTELYSCHEDGSVINWILPQNNDVILALKSDLIFPYGDNGKCLSISKILWKRYQQDYLIIFAGGLPRSDYMTKSTITIKSKNGFDPSKNNKQAQHLVLDLTSQLIDFTTIDDIQTGCVKYLLVLVEEEFFIVDLTKEGWPSLHDRQPYLNCLHHSPITAYHFLSEVNFDWFQKQYDIVNPKDNCNKLFYDDWPITGYGQSIRNDDIQILQNDLLIIGHGDGTVTFWRLGMGGCIKKMTTVKSSNLFKLINETYLNEDELIPFRRTGQFDPCCDDNRLAIQLIHYTGKNLLIGGYGGQIVLWGFVDSDYEKNTLEVDLTTHLPNFKWKGCLPLQHMENTVNTDSKFRPMMSLCIFPPSQITALDILDDKENSNQILIACGTLHGLVMVAIPKESNSQAIVLTTHCTVPKSTIASQEASLGEGWARRRTRELKKSLRSSFRRLRRRSTKRMEHPSVNRNISRHNEDKTARVEFVENEIEYEERAIEDRPKDTANDGLIRAIRIYISSTKRKAPNGPMEKNLNLFAGCYGGLMMWFQSDNSFENISQNTSFNVRLIKQYQFQHRAPILYFNMIGSDFNLTSLLKIHENTAVDNDSHLNRNQLLIITEEQIRLYAFPSFTLKCKIRVTAHDGFRLKSGNFIVLNDDRFSIQNNSKEPLVCATNNGGQFLLLNSGNLKRKDVVQYVDKTDLMALSFMSFGTSFSLFPSKIYLPYGVYYSGQGQITLFEIISKLKNIGFHSSGYRLNKLTIS